MSDELTLIRLQERRIQELERCQERYLKLIAELTRESIPQAEATEMRAQIASLIAEVGTLRQRLETCYGAISIHERRAEGLREEIRRLDESYGRALDEIDQRTEEARAWATALKTLASDLARRSIELGRAHAIERSGMCWAARMCEGAIQAIDPDYKLPENGDKRFVGTECDTPGCSFESPRCERHRAEHERAIANGMPPSGRCG